MTFAQAKACSALFAALSALDPRATVSLRRWEGKIYVLVQSCRGWRDIRDMAVRLKQFNTIGITID